MAKSKFAGLAEVNSPRPGGRGSYERPKAGKRTNPDYHQYSVLLTRESWRAAQAKLHGDGNVQFQWSTGRPDFSELMQSLLDEWLAKK